MIQCNTCGGTYEENCKNRRYFHSCAPVYNTKKKLYVERADKRDENIVQTQTLDEITQIAIKKGTARSKYHMKAKGTGTKEL